MDGPEVDEPPVVKHRVPPDLTDWDRDTLRRFPSVAVEIEAVVETDGTPSNVKVVKSDDDKVGEAVARAFESWRFSPGVLEGKPVRCRVVQRVVLKSEAEFKDRNQAPYLMRQIL